MLQESPLSLLAVTLFGPRWGTEQFSWVLGSSLATHPFAQKNQLVEEFFQAVFRYKKVRFTALSEGNLLLLVLETHQKPPAFPDSNTAILITFEVVQFLHAISMVHSSTLLRESKIA